MVQTIPYPACDSGEQQIVAPALQPSNQVPQRNAQNRFGESNRIEARISKILDEGQAVCVRVGGFERDSGAPPAPASVVSGCLRPCSFSQRRTGSEGGNGNANFRQRLRTVASKRSGCVVTSRKTVAGGGSSRFFSHAFCVFAFIASAG